MKSVALVGSTARVQRCIMIHVVRSEFTSPGAIGDFCWMIEQPDFDRCLFVFNDNETQFHSHQTLVGTPHVCRAGGGNAAIRPYQCQQPPRATGVPTGDGYGYQALDAHVKSEVDKAVAHLDALLDTGGYDCVVYSWDATSGTLGTGIFNVAREVTDYIVGCIDQAAWKPR